MTDDPIDLALEKTKRAKAKTKPRVRTNGAGAPDGLHYKSNGKLETNVHNARVILERDHKGKFRFNQCVLGIEYKRPGDPPHLLADKDLVEIQDMLQCNGMYTVGRETVRDAVSSIAENEFNAYHPIRDWLEFLEWDGVPRVNNLFSVYFGANLLAPSEYEQAISRMFLIGMVARVFEPGCQVDHMPVIEGPQGVKKSTACQVLAGEKYFGDSMPDISNKDSSQYLRGKWLIEVAEMHVHSRAETSAMKSFVSRRTERYFARYGRMESNEPRQCVFVGTTNEDEYLKDTTGGRRFWPIQAGFIDIEMLKRDREQLFAEAVARYKAGERWWPDGDFEKTHIKPEQDARLESDLWDDVVGRFLAGKTHVTAKQIVDHLINLEMINKERQGKMEKGRVRDILRKLGWITKRSSTARWWEKMNA